MGDRVNLLGFLKPARVPKASKEVATPLPAIVRTSFVVRLTMRIQFPANSETKSEEDAASTAMPYGALK